MVHSDLPPFFQCVCGQFALRLSQIPFSLRHYRLTAFLAWHTSPLSMPGFTKACYVKPLAWLCYLVPLAVVRVTLSGNMWGSCTLKSRNAHLQSNNPGAYNVISWAGVFYASVLLLYWIAPVNTNKLTATNCSGLINHGTPNRNLHAKLHKWG